MDAPKLDRLESRFRRSRDYTRRFHPGKVAASEFSRFAPCAVVDFDEFALQGGRVKVHLNYWECLDLVKCTGLRFSRTSPGTRRDVWPVAAWGRSRDIFVS